MVPQICFVGSDRGALFEALEKENQMRSMEGVGDVLQPRSSGSHVRPPDANRVMGAHPLTKISNESTVQSKAANRLRLWVI